MRDSNIDCVIIGYHELSLQSEIDRVTQMPESGHLRALSANTVALGDKRFSCLEFLNRGVERELGENPKLHVSAMPNLGVAYLRNFLYMAGFDVEMINFFDFERERLEELFTKNSVTSVAITTTFYTDDAPIRDIVKFVRACSPETKIIIGGPHILNICSFYQKETLHYSLRVMGADYYVFDSQGEATLTRLVRVLRDGIPDTSKIPNLFIRQGREVTRTDRVPENNDLEANRIQWRTFPRKSVTPTIMTRTARSCAFKCSFCTYPVLAGDLSLMGVDAIEQQLLELQDLGVENIAFTDDTFNVPLVRYKAICRMMIKNRFRIKWFSYLRCGNLDEEGLDLLAEAGCAGVFLGIESGDTDILKNMNKKAVPMKYKKGIVGLRERGVPCYASIIVGFPGENIDTVRRTTEFLQESEPTFFHPELYCHYQFAPVHGRAADFELKGTGYSWSHKTMDWRQAQDLLVDMITAVRQSTYLPTYSCDFWVLPYFYGHGLSMDFIRSFLGICYRIMLKGLASGTPDTLAEENELARLVRQSWPKKLSRHGLSSPVALSQAVSAAT